MSTHLYVRPWWSCLLGIALLVPSSPAALAAASSRGTDDAWSALAAAATALPEELDADGDGWLDTLEEQLGSDPADAASTPESMAIPESCLDGADNDADGLTDDADPGCQPPEIAVEGFPGEGVDAFDSTIKLEGYELATRAGACPLDFFGRGPVVVLRGEPAYAPGGGREVATEILSMQLTGNATLPAGTPCNPGTKEQSFSVTMVEDPEQASTGRVIPSGTGGADFPAESFFDVFFLIDTPLGLLPGGPPGGPAGSSVQVSNVIESIPPYHSPGNPARNPNCYSVAGLPHEHCPKPPLDHFKCYAGTFPRFTNVRATLEDQFGERRVLVANPDRLCNPVSKNQLRIFDEGAHLKRYLTGTPKQRRQPAFDPLSVPILNQFGPQQLTLLHPLGLLVPSQKDPHAPPAALDHFACYAVRGQKGGRTVSLVDQFDQADGRVEQVAVGEPVTLCAPVAKTVGDLTVRPGDLTAHLVCYSIKDRGFKPRRVTVRNQFGREVVRVTKPVELCVPSLKGTPVPIEPPTIDLSHRRIRVGNTIVVKGGGFTPGGKITKIFERPDGQVLHFQTQADEEGRFEGSLDIQQGQPAGIWQIYVRDEATGLWGQGTFKVFKMRRG